MKINLDNFEDLLKSKNEKVRLKAAQYVLSKFNDSELQALMYDYFKRRTGGDNDD
jgi:hypothetical protein